MGRKEILQNIDLIEKAYRLKVLYPHRRKHTYPNHAKDCLQCTPCVHDVFNYIRKQLGGNETTVNEVINELRKVQRKKSKKTEKGHYFNIKIKNGKIIPFFVRD